MSDVPERFAAVPILAEIGGATSWYVEDLEAKLSNLPVEFHGSNAGDLAQEYADYKNKLAYYDSLETGTENVPGVGRTDLGAYPKRAEDPHSKLPAFAFEWEKDFWKYWGVDLKFRCMFFPKDDVWLVFEATPFVSLDFRMLQTSFSFHVQFLAAHLFLDWS